MASMGDGLTKAGIRACMSCSQPHAMVEGEVWENKEKRKGGKEVTVKRFRYLCPTTGKKTSIIESAIVQGGLNVGDNPAPTPTPRTGRGGGMAANVPCRETVIPLRASAVYRVCPESAVPAARALLNQMRMRGMVPWGPNAAMARARGVLDRANNNVSCCEESAGVDIGEALAEALEAVMIEEQITLAMWARLFPGQVAAAQVGGGSAGGSGGGGGGGGGLNLSGLIPGGGGNPYDDVFTSTTVDALQLEQRNTVGELLAGQQDPTMGQVGSTTMGRVGAAASGAALGGMLPLGTYKPIGMAVGGIIGAASPEIMTSIDSFVQQLDLEF